MAHNCPTCRAIIFLKTTSLKSGLISGLPRGSLLFFFQEIFMNFRKILITSFLFLMVTSLLPAQSFKPEFLSSETHSEVQLSDWDTEKHYIASTRS